MIDERKISEAARETIKNRVVILEKRNYNTKELAPSEMVARIKKIIEEEVNKDGN